MGQSITAQQAVGNSKFKVLSSHQSLVQFINYYFPIAKFPLAVELAPVTGFTALIETI